MNLDEFRDKLWTQSREAFRRRCMERELREMTDDQEQLVSNWHNALHEEEGWFEEQGGNTEPYSWRNPNLSEEEREQIEGFINGLLARSASAEAGGGGCGRTDRKCCGGGCGG